MPFSISSPYRPWLLVVPVMLLIIGTAAAQSPYIKLSGRLPRMRMTSEALIQSGARVGPLTLAVWGTTENLGGDSIGTRLYAQGVQSNGALGLPRRLTPAGTHPIAPLQVMALADRFAVIWGNRASGDTNTMLTIVATDAVTFSDPIVLDDAPVVLSTITLIQIADGYLLVWRDSRGAMRSVSLDGSGKPRGPVTLFTGAGVLDLRDSTGYVVIDRGDSIPLIIAAASGQPVDLRGAAVKFAGSYHIGSDGSVAVLLHDTLRLYRTLLDSVPARSSVVRLPDDAVHGSAIVTRDTIGRIAILFAAGGGTLAAGPGSIDCMLEAIVETAPGTFASPVVIAVRSIASSASACERVAAEPIDATWHRSGVNTYSLSARFDLTDQITCPELRPATNVARDVHFIIDRNGEAVDSIPASGNPIPGVVDVWRIPSQTASLIAVPGPVLLTAPVNAFALRVPECREPHVRHVAGGTIVGWSAKADTVISGELAFLRDDGGVSPLPSYMAGERLFDTRFVDYPHVSMKLAQSGEMFVLAASLDWRSPRNSTGPRQRHQLTVNIPVETGTGWHEVLSIDSTSNDRPIAFAGMGYHRASGEILLAWRMTGPGASPAIHVNAVDSIGHLLWTIDSLDTPDSTVQLVPFGAGGDFAVISDAAITRYKARRVVARVAFDNRPVVSYGFTSDNDSLLIGWGWGGLPEGVVYGSYGGVIHPWALFNDSDFFDTDMFAVARGTDAALEVLYGTPRGVYRQSFTTHLAKQSEPEAITPEAKRALHPTGIFVGDSLFVAWEDYRDSSTAPAIYGRTVPVARAAAVAAMPGVASQAIEAIAPNPARDRVMIELAARVDRDATIEIVDLLGNVAAAGSIEAGGSSIAIDTRSLPAGTYIARVRAGAFIASKEFIIIP